MRLQDNTVIGGIRQQLTCLDQQHGGLWAPNVTHWVSMNAHREVYEGDHTIRFEANTTYNSATQCLTTNVNITDIQQG